MKKSGIVLMLGLSLVLAMGASLLALSWLGERVAADDSAEASVVAADRQIPFGEKLQRADLRLMELPPHAIPEGSFEDMEEVIGRVAAQSIYPGEVIRRERVPEDLGGSALAAVLDHGKRAITVRVDDVVGVAGFVLPGNRVDVVSSRRDGGNREVKSETILRDIEVLAVDQNASPERDSPVIVRAVTLEVSPSQAERLVEATQEGRVQLTLRNPLDDAEDEQLVAEAEPEPEPEAEPEPEPVRTRPAPRGPRHLNVTVIRGTSASTTTVHE